MPRPACRFWKTQTSSSVADGLGLLPLDKNDSALNVEWRMESETLSSCSVFEKSTPSTSGREKDAKKLRSRHAAQSRRILENTEFDSLAVVLPIPRAISSNLLDKASVVRLATSFLKLHRFCVRGQPSWVEERSFDYQYSNSFSGRAQVCSDVDFKLGTRILEALDGFLFCLGDDGTILYVSETVSVGLGLSQIEMIGNRVFDYIHYDDMDSWHPIFNRHHPLLANEIYDSTAPCKVIARFKSSLVKRATKDTQESSLGYKVVEFYISPRIAPCDDNDPAVVDSRLASSQSCLISGFTGYALPLLCSSTPECRLDRNAFVITTLLDFKIHYVDAKAEEILLGTKSVPVRGTSVYTFVHTDDVNILSNFHKEVLKMGASTSNFFRLLSAKGGCMWTQANGVRVNRIRARQSQCSIIAMLCYAIGLDDFEESILASHQLQYACDEEHRSWPSTEYQEEATPTPLYAFQ